MIKILFLIHDLGHGGAEKVLVNLVNNMDLTKFDITVMALFDGGVNRQFLRPEIKYKACFKHTVPGNSKLMKLLSPKQLHKWLIKEHYDIEVAYLEGPSARIISGCPDKSTKLISWMHSDPQKRKAVCGSFRSFSEAYGCYSAFDRCVCVAEKVKDDLLSIFDLKVPTQILYNTNESDRIIASSAESIPDGTIEEDRFTWCGVGKILPNKGFDRMIKIQKRLLDEGYHTELLILGVGPQQEELEKYCEQNGMLESVKFLGYQTNPYKYVAKCDLFVCASHAEGFSTAATEALIVGTPVCTVEVSGMKEMLGENNEYGIVTENDDEALYKGIKSLIDAPELLAHYKRRAEMRGKTFSTENTVKAVEEMLEAVYRER